jgi:hypothetical protein
VFIVRDKFSEWPTVTAGGVVVYHFKIIAVSIFEPHNVQAPSYIAFIDKIQRLRHFFARVLKQNEIFARLFCD